MNVRYNSLEDYLTSHPLNLDGRADDGWGEGFSAKGREIEATVLFADITGFSRRTLDLTPAENLIFVNHFFTWISVEGLRGRPGIVDKYIGDEMMVVFSTEFGSKAPFVDAVQTACGMISRDVLAFSPHIGISSGPVVVGYVGTPIKYNCSVFGRAVTLAARCASAKPGTGEGWEHASLIFPASEWKDRDIDDVVPPESRSSSEGKVVEEVQKFNLLPSRNVQVKNMPDLEVRGLASRSIWIPSGFSAEIMAKEYLQTFKEKGRYRPASPEGC